MGSRTSKGEECGVESLGNRSPPGIRCVQRKQTRQDAVEFQKEDGLAGEIPTCRLSET
jgi:hypothetical protein